MNEPKPNPNELQPTGMSDEDTERMVQNYVVMEELKGFDPSQVTWVPMKETEQSDKD